MVKRNNYIKVSKKVEYTKGLIINLFTNASMYVCSGIAIQ